MKCVKQIVFGGFLWSVLVLSTWANPVNMDALVNPEKIKPAGKWHEATVPDTLDLADHARLAINCLTGNVDPDNRYLVFQSFDFGEKPPAARQPSGLHSKNCRALPLMRTMCGSEQNLDIECEIIKRIHGTFMLENCYHRDPDANWLNVFKNEADRFNPHAPNIIYVEDRAFIPPESSLTSDGKWIFIGGENPSIPYNPPEEPNDDHVGLEGCVKWHQMYFMRGLMCHYRYGQNEQALELIRKMTRFCLRPELWEDTGDQGFPGNEHGIWGGHWHGGMGALQMLLEVALLENDDHLKRIVQEGYDHAMRLAKMQLGWVPCWSTPTKYKRGESLRFIHESCGTADTLILAVKLSDAGLGDYWNDVERVARRLALQQWTDREAMLERAGGDAASNALIERFVGGFGNGALHSRLYQTTGCCSANGSIGLYYAWHGITRFDKGVATVNMFLNRASAWMDVDSYLPYEGRVVLHNKQAKTALVRVPSYVNPDEVKCFVDGELVEAPLSGRNLVFTGLAGGEKIKLEFPLRQDEAMYTVNDIPYEVTTRGASVLRIEPNEIQPKGLAYFPHHYKIYPMEGFDQGATPMRKIQRFVSDRVIPLQ